MAEAARSSAILMVRMMSGTSTYSSERPGCSTRLRAESSTPRSRMVALIFRNSSAAVGR